MLASPGKIPKVDGIAVKIFQILPLSVYYDKYYQFGHGFKRNVYIILASN